MKRISWIASYPKSGNTWFRAFLTALIGKDLEGPLLQELEGGPIASAKELFDLEAGVDSGDLKQSEIQAIRPDIFRSYALNSNERLYLKIHDARVDNTTHIDIIPADVTQAAIYLIRNPLDIVGSWANHAGISIEKAAQSLLDENHILASSSSPKYKNQLQQYLGTWSFHVQSWTEQTRFPVLPLRYEDLLESPLPHFQQATQFLQLDKSQAEIENAINAARFDKLQSWESANGFKERPKKSKRFFRKGKAGNWRQELPIQYVERIIEAHGKTMQRFGYLDPNGQPT